MSLSPEQLQIHIQYALSMKMRQGTHFWTPGTQPEFLVTIGLVKQAPEDAPLLPGYYFRRTPFGGFPWTRGPGWKPAPFAEDHGHLTDDFYEVWGEYPVFQKFKGVLKYGAFIQHRAIWNSRVSDFLGSATVPPSGRGSLEGLSMVLQFCKTYAPSMQDKILFLNWKSKGWRAYAPLSPVDPEDWEGDAEDIFDPNYVDDVIRYYQVELIKIGIKPDNPLPSLPPTLSDEIAAAEMTESEYLNTLA